MFWTILWFFLWVAWLFLLFRVIFDIFRSKDLGGWGKAIWAIFVVIIPWLGVLVYLIARGRGMTDRDLEQAPAHQDAFKQYVQQTAGTCCPNTADALATFSSMSTGGALTDAEFNTQK